MAPVACAIMGFGTEEYRLITRGSTYFFCLLIIVAFFLKVDVTRMYLLLLIRWACSSC